VLSTEQTQARSCVRIVLQALQNLYEVTPPRKQIMRHEVIREVERLQGVVLNPQNSEFSVLLGKGDGSFGAPANYFAGNVFWSIVEPPSFVVADVNSDGIPDLVTIGAAGLSVLLGKGDGSFQAPTFTAASSILNLLATADLNGDGNADLLAYTTSGLQVLLGNDNGTFRYLPPLNLLLDDLSSVHLVDLNGDGKLDLVQIFSTRSPIATSVQTFLGNGDGTFADPVTVLQPPAGNLLFVGDFDHDNRPDLAAAVGGNQNGSPWGITTLLQTPNAATMVSFAPNTITFAAQAVGTTSSPAAVRLTNAGTTISLNISNIGVVGENANDFGQTNDCPTSSPLAPGASCQISVTFAPGAVGPRSASISVSDGAPAARR